MTECIDALPSNLIAGESPFATVGIGDSTLLGTSDTGLRYRVSWMGFIPLEHGAIWNRGFDGLTYADQTSGHATWEDLGGTPTRKILHIVSGINDLNTGLTSAQLQTNAIALVAMARPRYDWITIQTVTSSTFWSAVPAKMTQWKAWNTWLRANALTTVGVNYLVDVASDPRYGADLAWQNTAVFYDGTHLQPGEQKVLWDRFYRRAHDAGRRALSPALFVPQEFRPQVYLSEPGTPAPQAGWYLAPGRGYPDMRVIDVPNATQAEIDAFATLMAKVKNAIY